MSLSHKHYQAVADILRYERQTADWEASDYYKTAALHTIASIEGQLICYFHNTFRKAAQP